ncbi:MAG TPA: gephyrin-like molybdotransferase Glp [Thermoanaerobaculia bacterium]
MVGSFQAKRPREGLITVEEAQARVLAEVEAVEAEEVALADAHGRVLREDVTAPADVPPVDNSAMDGYAVRAADVAGASDASPATLRVIGDIAADADARVTVTAGTAVRIMTGGAIPDGADAVIQVEQTDAGSDHVQIYRSAESGTNLRRAGEDMRAGDVVLRSGIPIGPGELGVLATMRKQRVRVGPQPKVAILSTGDEIVSGRVANSNSYALAALAREAGCIVTVLPAVPDDREATKRALRKALELDVVISSGGVSQGAYDFVKESLEELGAETKFWQVLMKPGKPVVFSRAGSRFVFGLPGNPVSCIVGFLLFVRPALRKMMGLTSNLLLPAVHVRAAVPFSSRGDRRMYFRVQVIARDGELFATPAKAQGSGISTSMIGANGLAWLEPGETRIDTGSSLPVLIFAPLLSEEWRTIR